MAQKEVIKRNYIFKPTVDNQEIVGDRKAAYLEFCKEHVQKVQDETAKLNASESYSLKVMHASGKNFLGGYLVDESGIRRPDNMPAGETWMYKQFEFDTTAEMEEKKNYLVTCLNDPNKMREEVGVLLTDEQIYYSKVEFDVQGETGSWTFWYKTN